MKKLLISLLKIAISVGIIGYLVVDAVRVKTPTGDASGEIDPFGGILEQATKGGLDWRFFAAAWFCAAGAVLLTLIRWCYLVRALGIQLRMRDSLRIGLLGYLYNLAPLGIVGGDVLKAVMLAREHPGNRAKAAASVIMDRLVGLYMLFVVATAGILLTGFWDTEIRQVFYVCLSVIVLMVVATAAIAWLLMRASSGRSSAFLLRIPRVGPLVATLIEDTRLYRHNLGALAGSAAMTIGVHLLFASSLCGVALGLGITSVPARLYFAVGPTANIASTVPLPAGPLEGALVFFFTQALGVSKLNALIIGLAFRLIAVSVAAAGFCYYLASRRQVSAVMHEAEEVEAAGCV